MIFVINLTVVIELISGHEDNVFAIVFTTAVHEHSSADENEENCSAASDDDDVLELEGGGRAFTSIRNDRPLSGTNSKRQFGRRSPFRYDSRHYDGEKEEKISSTCYGQL